MRILWVTNVPFAYHNEMLGRPNGAVGGGSWLYAAYDAVRKNTSIELHVVTSCPVERHMKQQFENSWFHILPGGNMKTYDHTSSRNRQMCEQLRAEISPDIVVIWGTESKLAYLISEVFRSMPILVYMQGVIQSIYQRYYDGVPFLCRYRTLRDIVNLFDKHAQYQNFRAQTKLEQKILHNAKAVIVENDWCEDMCKMINPDLVFFRNKLPIRADYFNYDWNIDNIERHTIFANAGGYSIKGHHILYQALVIVKKIYPDVKVYIPGNNYLKAYGDFKHRTGYFRWLQQIVDRHQLAENIEFTGVLTPAQMARYIQRCNVYVMPSVCENHSASLIEALIVGAPSVASLVGGVGTLIENKKNGIIYNSVDYMSLAGNIVRIFSDERLALTLSDNARKIRSLRQGNFGREMDLIYAELAK